MINLVIEVLDSQIIDHNFCILKGRQTMVKELGNSQFLSHKELGKEFWLIISE